MQGADCRRFGGAEAGLRSKGARGPQFVFCESFGLTASGFAFGELLGKAPQVTKGACSWFGPSFVRVPSLRSRSVGPRRTDIHVLTALSPHPCGSAHCARPAFSLHPSRVLWCLGFLHSKIKINCFPAKAGPTDLTRTHCRTGFSREEAGVITKHSLNARAALSGTGFSREEARMTPIKFFGKHPPCRSRRAALWLAEHANRFAKTTNPARWRGHWV